MKDHIQPQHYKIKQKHKHVTKKGKNLSYKSGAGFPDFTSSLPRMTLKLSFQPIHKKYYKDIEAESKEALVH